PSKASVFVMFRHGQPSSLAQAIRSVSRNRKRLLVAGDRQTPPRIQILSATYGVPDQPEHARDVSAIIQRLVADGQTVFPVTALAAVGGDPDHGVVKTLNLHYRINGKEIHRQLDGGELVDLTGCSANPPVAIEAGPKGGIQLFLTQPGRYRCALASGKTVMFTVPSIPRPITLQGPWTVKFPSGWGAPDQVQLDKLIAWNRHPDAGVRFFSGTASYHAEFDVPASLLTGRHRLDLDLGAVAVMAGVTLNDRPLGILWKPPFRVDATSVLRAGRNTLEIAVANLWINRMIGDQQLPADSDRARDGHLLRWPQWLLEGKPSPTGRFTFTTWELWHKTDPLVESGLIGPVRLLTAVCKPLVSL
ncbi:MAG: glycosylhydrolase-like jelly roll fold domain-containing protein, partial [Limisphaerales bacterium]